MSFTQVSPGRVTDPFFSGSPSGELAGLATGHWATTFPGTLESRHRIAFSLVSREV